MGMVVGQKIQNRGALESKWVTDGTQNLPAA